MLRRMVISSVAVFSLFAWGSIFADEEVRETSTRNDSVSEDPIDRQDRERENQKTVDDLNAFLIESYKIKLDRALSEVYQSVRTAAKDNPAIQEALLRRILSEIEVKMSALSDRPVSPNRKKILLAVFAYMRYDIDLKIRMLEGK